MTKGKMDLATFIRFRIETSGYTQAEIAKAAGLRHSNFISMIARGKSKIPLARIPKLADILGVQRRELMWLCLETYEPELFAILTEMLPDVPILPDEVALIRGYRILKEKGVVDGTGVEIRSCRRGSGREAARIWSRIE